MVFNRILKGFDTGVNRGLTGLKRFCQDEGGNVTVGLSVIFPMLVLFMIYTEQTWQAHYIRIELQAILDFASLGAAETGNAEYLIGSQTLCSIPYDENDQLYSGEHVATELIYDNMHVLPNQMQQELTAQLRSNQIDGMKNRDEQLNGYMSLRTNIKYRTPMSLFYNAYVFNIESSARCQPYTE